MAVEHPDEVVGARENQFNVVRGKDLWWGMNSGRVIVDG